MGWRWMATAAWATLATAADDLPLHTLDLRTRISLEVLRLPDGEDMGLAGLHEDAFPFAGLDQVYVGIGGYGAVSGTRGGFFILGLSAGWRQRLWGPLGIDVGAFAGGGGGTRDSGQGDGLMLRGQGLATWAFPGWSLQGGISGISFPGGTIADRWSWTVGATVDDALTLIGPGTGTPRPVTTTQPWSITPLWYRYELDQPTAGRAGPIEEVSVDVIGVEIARHLDEHWSLPVRLGGALGGNRAGYMDVAAGVAARIGDTWWAEARALAGCGGGGDYLTGGGLFLHPEIAVGVGTTITGEVRVGRLDYLEGDFHAWTAGLGLGWQPDLIGLEGRGTGTVATDAVAAEAWRILMGSTTARIDGRAEAVRLIEVAIEKPVLSWLDAFGRSRSAYDGDAGSYSEGLLGLRLHQGWGPIDLGLSLAVGAGGGGGLDTGTGAIADAVVDLRWEVLDGMALFASLGRLIALDTDLEEDLVGLGLLWTFRLPHTR